VACASSITFLLLGIVMIYRSDMTHVSEEAIARLHDVISDWNGTFRSEILDTKVRLPSQCWSNV
jgi:hypothetical protein